MDDQHGTPAPDTAATELGQALTLGEGEFPGSYRATISRGWTIGGGINGGLLLSVVAKGLATAMSGSGHVEPLAVTAYYLSPTRPGEALVETDIARTGGSASTGSAALVQYEDDGRRQERMRVLGSFTDLGRLPAETVKQVPPPDMPPQEKCVSPGDAPELPFEADLLERIEVRLDPATAMWALGQPSGNGMIQGWMRMTDGHEPDPFVLLLACDALPPVSGDLGVMGWAPTLELSVQVLARPEPGWLRVRHQTEHVAAGHFVEDCRIWDSAGRLVAQSRQLARMPRPA